MYLFFFFYYYLLIQCTRCVSGITFIRYAQSRKVIYFYLVKSNAEDVSHGIIRNNSTKIRINNQIRTNLEQPELPHIIPAATKSSRSASILSNLGYPIISPYSQRQLKKQMKQRISNILDCVSVCSFSAIPWRKQVVFQ